MRYKVPIRGTQRQLSVSIPLVVGWDWDNDGGCWSRLGHLCWVMAAMGIGSPARLWLQFEWQVMAAGGWVNDGGCWSRLRLPSPAPPKPPGSSAQKPCWFLQNWPLGGRTVPVLAFQSCGQVSPRCSVLAAIRMGGCSCAWLGAVLKNLWTAEHPAEPTRLVSTGREGHPLPSDSKRNAPAVPGGACRSFAGFPL
jgi:hypothetical protein